MKSSSPDPHLHAPRNAAEDSDGGKACVPAVLPARRTIADAAPDNRPAEVGLRIDLHRAPSATTDARPRLAVQEIGPIPRLDQAVEAPPKVERQFTFHPRPPRHHGKSRDGEGGDWGNARRYPALWIFGVALLVTLPVISALMLLPSINAPNAPRQDSGAGLFSVVDEEKLEGMEIMNQLVLKQPEALQIFRSYAHASHADEVLPLIKDGRLLAETLREHWRPLEISKSWRPDADSAWSVLDIGGAPYGLMEGTFADQTKFAAYFAYQDGHFLLDWKATVAYGTARFGELGEGTGDASEIRGEISVAEFYSAVWPEADYQSYRLTSPAREISIWCYARRGETAEGALGTLFYKGEITDETPSSRKITLRLARGPAQALPNQWLIGEMLHIDWATP